MARSERTNRLIAAVIVPSLMLAALATPAVGKKGDPTAQPGDSAATVPADANTGEIPTAVPPDTSSGTPVAGPGMPTFPGFGEQDEVGGVIEPGRIVTLVQECESISVAGLAVAAHNCANGIDVAGTLPPGAPWTVFTASKDSFTMAAPVAKSGKKADIQLPFSAEPLRQWVHEETGVRLRRKR